MKIAMILPHFYPYVGGAETMFYELAKGMVERGHEVHVVAEKVDDEHDGQVEVDGIQVNYCRWKSAFGHPFPKKKDIRPEIEWCDVVHTSIFTTAPIVSELAHKYKKPALLTVYEVRGHKWFWSDVFHRAVIYDVVEQYCCRKKFDVYHAISDATKDDYHKYCGKKKDVRRVYLAIEMGKDQPINSDFKIREYFKVKDEFIFLYYGRPGRTKGVYVYEKAICILKQRGVDLTKVRFCFLLGKEPVKPRREFLERMKNDHLRGQVRVRPSLPREDLAACIRQADCVVVPSLTEGFGFSALETCQSGTPLIYSDGGSLPEVAYGKCKSFKNRDANDLADKLQAVIEGREDAFDDVPEKTFPMEDMLGGIEEIYNEMVTKC